MCGESPAVYVTAEDQNSDPHSCTTVIYLPRPCCLLKNKQNKTKQVSILQIQDSPCFCRCMWPPAFAQSSSCRIYMMQPLPVYPDTLPRLTVSNYSSKHCIVSIISHVCEFICRIFPRSGLWWVKGAVHLKF